MKYLVEINGLTVYLMGYRITDVFMNDDDMVVIFLKVFIFSEIQM